MVLGAVGVGGPINGSLRGVWLESCEDSSTLLSGAWAGDDVGGSLLRDVPHALSTRLGFLSLGATT